MLACVHEVNPVISAGWAGTSSPACPPPGRPREESEAKARPVVKRDCIISRSPNLRVALPGFWFGV